MLTPRRLFEDTNGFDDVCLALHYYDIDYCLRLRALGHRIIVTPHALISDSRPAADWADQVPSLRLAVARELSVLRHRWAIVPGCDPFYSPWLSMDEALYTGLAWPPITSSIRLPLQQPPRPAHPGL